MLLELQITQTTHPLWISDGKNVFVQHLSKNKFFFSNLHKKGGAYLQCVNNYYAKFEH